MLGTTSVCNRLQNGLWPQTSLQDAVSCPTRVGENIWKEVGRDPRQYVYTLLPFPATAAIPSKSASEGISGTKESAEHEAATALGAESGQTWRKKICLGTRASRRWFLVRFYHLSLWPLATYLKIYFLLEFSTFLKWCDHRNMIRTNVLFQQLNVKASAFCLGKMGWRLGRL